MNRTISTAWSESKESALSYSVQMFGWLIWMCSALAIAGVFIRSVALAAIFLCGALICAGIRHYDRAELEKILKNRPYHGNQGLTRWHWHNSVTSHFPCPCGRTLTFEGAYFYANEVDPHGGRYSLVCECGRGHYKFRGELI